jgi:hydrogenase expression/formation protein HypE
LSKWVGKLPSEILDDVVLSKVNSYKRPSTLVGAEIGEDSALIDLGFCVLSVHSDPITEARFHAGSLAVDVATNDLAVTGVRPKWLILDMLMPEGSLYSSLNSIVESAVNEAKRLNVEIVGGHTESTPGLISPIIVGTAIGCSCKDCFYPTRNAKEGDLIYQINPAGLEGSAIIATDFRDIALKKGLPNDILERASDFIKRISIVNEALEVSERKLVNSLHDPTEGGMLGGLYEIAYASKHNIRIDLDKIFVEEETKIISQKLKIDYTKLISSGTIIVTVPPSNKNEIERVLDSIKVKYEIIGRVLNPDDKPKVNLYKNNSLVSNLNSPPQDEISKLWVMK